MSILERCEDGFEGSKFFKGSGEDTRERISSDDNSGKVLFPNADASRERNGNESKSTRNVKDMEKSKAKRPASWAGRDCRHRFTLRQIMVASALKRSSDCKLPFTSNIINSTVHMFL